MMTYYIFDFRIFPCYTLLVYQYFSLFPNIKRTKLIGFIFTTYKYFIYIK